MMDRNRVNTDMKKLVVGILAHVDSGKTTLSEAMLYTAGKIRKLGRVDHKDAYLDTDAQERERGITIFSKQAVFTYDDMEITLLDTPGHVDFSAEMERTLQVLDYAILVINGMDGVQSHTDTLWKLLKRYEIPTFIFVNKMDMDGSDKDAVFQNIRKSWMGIALISHPRTEMNRSRWQTRDCWIPIWIVVRLRQRISSKQFLTERYFRVSGDRHSNSPVCRNYWMR